MLEKKVLIEGDAVEKYFCIPFHDKIRNSPEKMDDKLTELMAKMFLAKTGHTEAMQHFREKIYTFRILESHLKALECKLENNLIVFLFSLTADSPGKIVMYTAYLKWWMVRHKVEVLALDLFAERIFPWGFQSDENLQELWDGQKVYDGGNLLDHSKCYASFCPEIVE